MIRAQIQFEQAQYEQIRSLAHRKRTSIAEMVRRLVSRGLRAGLGEGGEEPGLQALLEISGIGASGLPDLGRRHDEYLAEDLER